MKSSNGILHNRIFSMVLILTGILVGLLLSLLAAWADYEATSYGFMRRAQAPLRGLSCPIFMGKNESNTVAIRISNPTEQTIFPGITTQISTPQEIESSIDHVELQPGEEFKLERTVGPQNIDLGLFIIVDAQVSAMYPLPARENTCGILVLPVRNGASIVVIGIVLSLLLMATGIFLLYKNKLPANRPNSILFLVAATILSMTFSFIGWWLQAIVVIVVLLLTLLLTAGSYFQRTY